MSFVKRKLFTTMLSLMPYVAAASGDQSLEQVLRKYCDTHQWDEIEDVRSDVSEPLLENSVIVGLGLGHRYPTIKERLDIKKVLKELASNSKNMNELYSKVSQWENNQKTLSQAGDQQNISPIKEEDKSIAAIFTRICSKQEFSIVNIIDDLEDVENSELITALFKNRSLADQEKMWIIKTLGKFAEESQDVKDFLAETSDWENSISFRSSVICSDEQYEIGNVREDLEDDDNSELFVGLFGDQNLSDQEKKRFIGKLRVIADQSKDTREFYDAIADWEKSSVSIKTRKVSKNQQYGIENIKEDLSDDWDDSILLDAIFENNHFSEETKIMVFGVFKNFADNSLTLESFYAKVDGWKLQGQDHSGPVSGNLAISHPQSIKKANISGWIPQKIMPLRLKNNLVADGYDRMTLKKHLSRDVILIIARYLDFPVVYDSDPLAPVEFNPKPYLDLYQSDVVAKAFVRIESGKFIPDDLTNLIVYFANLQMNKVIDISGIRGMMNYDKLELEEHKHIFFEGTPDQLRPWFNDDAGFVLVGKRGQYLIYRIEGFSNFAPDGSDRISCDYKTSDHILNKLGKRIRNIATISRASNQPSSGLEIDVTGKPYEDSHHTPFHRALMQVLIGGNSGQTEATSNIYVKTVVIGSVKFVTVVQIRGKDAHPWRDYKITVFPPIKGAERAVEAVVKELAK